MKRWLRWAFFYEDKTYNYGAWNIPDDIRAVKCQEKPGIERVEIHGKIMHEDQRTEVLAVLSGADYQKIMFDMKQVFSPIYGTTCQIMYGMRLVSKNNEEQKIIGVK